jgi:hypothetical protein
VSSPAGAKEGTQVRHLVLKALATHPGTSDCKEVLDPALVHRAKATEILGASEMDEQIARRGGVL